MVFEADFKESDAERTLEILMFADAAGNVDFIEVDFCVNSHPVPNDLILSPVPYHTFLNPAAVIRT